MIPMLFILYPSCLGFPSCNAVKFAGSWMLSSSDSLQHILKYEVGESCLLLASWVQRSVWSTFLLKLYLSVLFLYFLSAWNGCICCKICDLIACQRLSSLSFNVLGRRYLLRHQETTASIVFFTPLPFYFQGWDVQCQIACTVIFSWLCASLIREKVFAAICLTDINVLQALFLLA